MGDRNRLTGTESTILGGTVLRARTPAGIDRELYPLLTIYQLLRTAMADTTTVPGTDPDRASFNIAWPAARDRLIQEASIIAGAVIDLAAPSAASSWPHLLAARRLRASPRIVRTSHLQMPGPRP